jgi:hypothetical protein
MMLAMGGVVLHACVTGASYVDLAMKCLNIFTLANGVLMAVAPGTASEIFGMNSYKESNAAYKTLGYLLLGLGIFGNALIFFDMDPIKAFGYGWIPALLLQISNNFITKENDELNIPKLPSYLWMLVDAIVVITCGF